MGRLKRKAHQQHLREHKKLKRRAIAAGTAVAITLGAGVSVSKALAAHIPDPHEMPVGCDADADLLTNREEFAMGYQVFEPDQNRNEIPDGVELAKQRCAADIDELPWQNEALPGETYKWWAPQFGVEHCDICGAEIVMGPGGVKNPRLGISVEFPFLMTLHYIEHGSFSYAAHYGEAPVKGRIDVPGLLRALELRFPYDPNEHQLPVDGNDFDKDLLTDNEELKAGYDLYDADQDANIVPDGVELAKQCREIIDGLPLYEPGITQICKKENLLRGIEHCDICSAEVNMGTIEIINPSLQLSTEVPLLVLHYMEHGSFSYAGDYHGKGRIDVGLLVKTLEMPRRCGDLGTIYLPGDLNKDCKVDLKDFAEFTDKWLGCTDPNEGECNK